MNVKIKRILSLILCLTLCASVVTTVMAQNETNERGIVFSAELDKNTLSVSDEDQTVVMTIKAAPGATFDGMGMTLVCDTSLTIASVKGGDAIENNNPFTTNIYDANSKKITWGTSDMEVITNVTDLVIVTITVPANTPAGNYTVGATDIEMTDDYAGNIWESGASVSATLTITESSPEEPSTPVVEGYTAQVTADSTVIAGKNVTVNIGVNHNSDTTFHAAEIILNYDSTALTLVTSSLNDKYYTNENGVLTFEDFDNEHNFGTGVYTFTFTANTVGDTTVTLASAKFLHKEAASSSDLIAATINPATATITIKAETVSVEQNENNIGVTAPTEAVKNEDYTFEVEKYNLYDYTITATVGEAEVEVVDNGDGTYTIAGENVTDTIVITSKRAAKEFDVTWDGEGVTDVTGEKPLKATYDGNGISFTVPSNKPATPTEDGANYSATVTIGETTTSYAAGETVTIQGSQITDDVSIVITKTVVTANGKTVTISGADVTFADGSTIQTVAPNSKLTLKLTVESGYTYSVKIGDEEIMNNAITTYELTVTDNATIVVTKTLNITNVEATDYLSVGNDQKLWLVTFKTTLAEGKVATYNGETMFWSTKYEAYCYLVSGETLNAETAKSLLNVTTTDKKQVDYSGNVNKTTLIDAADAQFVANMYNGMYSAIDNTTTMEMFLSADMNGDKIINTEDAVTIINQILGINN